MEQEFSVPQGRFRLTRQPYRKNELLQAWDAADDYLLHHLAEHEALAGKNIAILNDSFGALVVALSEFRPTAISDSWLSQQATRENLAANAVAADRVLLLDSLSLPSAPIDRLFIKVPKTLALLEYQLHRLRPLLQPDCRIVAAGMVKTLPASAWKLLERLVGPTVPSLARKKARLIFAGFDPNIRLPPNPYPTYYRLTAEQPPICNHANVFSRESLDIGARFLLQHLPESALYRDFIDLGCGNGVIGLRLAELNPDANIVFVDESFMAIASATENFRNRFGDSAQAKFVVGDCLSGFAPASADCIVCNPPFHQQHAIGDHIAWRMFQQAHAVLRPGGELRVIGNRHLNYHITLKKLFGCCRQLAANAKFAIFSCEKA
ncbi:methyltransferase [Methylomonas sp. DH-1]|uniref:methyltransferase n=1 Tax=Methylomonas sp. (strain DH-1) TaxID=1727196 RepID=UPI0007C8AE71|nr:methyltransferase [Methylomonas sp. DH-1]ANE54795.1 50S rRNA methyltransferase [Methylomonas sp. DH-1]